MNAVTGSPDVDMEPSPDPREEARQEAREARRDFTEHVIDYTVVNTCLIGFWAISPGYFWPAWVLAIWGVLLGLHAWRTFLPRPPTDGDVDAEPSRPTSAAEARPNTP